MRGRGDAGHGDSGHGYAEIVLVSFRVISWIVVSVTRKTIHEKHETETRNKESKCDRNYPRVPASPRLRVSSRLFDLLDS